MRENDSAQVNWNDTDLSWEIKTPEQKRIAFKALSELFRSLNLEDQDSLLSLLNAPEPSTKQEALTWDELKELDSHPLITIGAHTRRHPILSSISSEDANLEISQSKNILEDRLGHPIRHLAYPFGDQKSCGSREREFAKGAGFDSAVTTTSGHFQDESKNCLFGLPRVVIDYFDNFEDFLWKIYGFEAYSFHKGKDFPGFS